MESLRQVGWFDLFESDIQALLIFDPLITYGVILMPLISNCSMMPAWHQLVSMSGHVEESETARKLQLYATSIYQVHSFVCQLDYLVKISCGQHFWVHFLHFFPTSLPYFHRKKGGVLKSVESSMVPYKEPF